MLNKYKKKFPCIILKQHTHFSGGVEEVNGLCDMEALIEQAFVFAFNFQFSYLFARLVKLGIVFNNHAQQRKKKQ